VVPSQTANSVHVMRMCGSFAGLGLAVNLYTWPGLTGRVRGQDATTAFESYGVSSGFEVKTARRWRLPGSRWAYAAQAVADVWRRRQDDGWVLARCPSAALLAARAGIPTLFEVHSLPRRQSRMARFTIPMMLRSKHLLGVIAITQALRSDVGRAFGYAADQILVLPDGAAPFPTDVVRAIAPTARFQVGYVGHLYAGKAMEVIAVLCRLTPWADFHVVGGRAEDLQYWRARLGADSNVTFHGHVSHRDVPKWLASFDVAILPNQASVSSSGTGDIGRYTSPLKLFEYMAAGKAIVASDLAVLREVVTDGDNALLCACDDPAAWARALERLRDDVVLRHNLGERARSQFLNGLSWDARAAKVVQFYHSRLAAAGQEGLESVVAGH
jgi:glycosyltransferase involved in cell wall biosynthesis